MGSGCGGRLAGAGALACILLPPCVLALGGRAEPADRRRRAPRIKVKAVVVDPGYNGRKDERDFAVLTLASAPAAEPVALATPARVQGGHAARPDRALGRLG